MESEFVTIKQAAEILGIPYTEAARRLQLSVLTRVPAEEVPLRERSGRCRTYIRRAELALPQSLKERHDWLTSREAADLLGLSPISIRYRIQRGDLTPLSMPIGCRTKGEKHYFARQEVERLRDQWRPLPIREYEMTPTLAETAYLAGIVDGEGCILICRKGASNPAAADQYYVQLQVANTHLGLLSWIKKTFGGNIYHVRRASRGQRASYHWAAAHILAHHILLRISPFLLVKQAQSHLAIEFQLHLRAYGAGPWKPVSESELAWRIRQKERISCLNHNGSLDSI